MYVPHCILLYGYDMKKIEGKRQRLSRGKGVAIIEKFCYKRMSNEIRLKYFMNILKSDKVIIPYIFNSAKVPYDKRF